MAGNHSRQCGSVAVEFALVATLFFTALTAVANIGGLLAVAVSAADATRTAARIAAVCDPGGVEAAAAVRARLPQFDIGEPNLAVTYSPAGCSGDTCRSVRVSLHDLSYPAWIPFLPASLPLPAFDATLPVESLESVNDDGESNPVCRTA
jgi:Flp pilus assembly protein TadG